jgi:hypothetical protein
MIYTSKNPWRPVRPIGVIPAGFIVSTFTNANGVFMVEVYDKTTGETAYSNEAHRSKSIEETAWDTYNFLISGQPST